MHWDLSDVATPGKQQGAARICEQLRCARYKHRVCGTPLSSVVMYSQGLTAVAKDAE